MSKSYRMGDVGPNALVQQGENLTLIESALAPLPDGEALTRQFETLVSRLTQALAKEDDVRELAVNKTRAVAEGLGRVSQEPGKLRISLLDAKTFLLSSASWAWDELAAILKSDAAQKTIGTITEATVRSAITQIAGS